MVAEGTLRDTAGESLESPYLGKSKNVPYSAHVVRRVGVHRRRVRFVNILCVPTGRTSRLEPSALHFRAVALGKVTV